MKKILISVLTAATAATASAANPFFQEFNTVHSTVPFNSVKTADYEEAIDRGIQLAQQEIDAICAQKDAPTFQNTIVAYERSGKDLDRVVEVFDAMTSAMNDPEMMDLSLRVYQKLSDFSTSVTLNEALWKRVKTVYDNVCGSLGGTALDGHSKAVDPSDQYTLDPEDQMLLQKTYDAFALQGANLEGADRDTFKQLSADLSDLTTRFGQNVLKELYTYEIWLTKDDLDGLPQSSIDAAALAAKEKGREGEYLFTLAQPTYMAFMKYSKRRDLREKMYRLYNGRNTQGEFSNKDIIRQISQKRLQLANLLGSKTYAEHKLKRTMAQSPAGVYDLLDRLRDAYVPAMKAEMTELNEFARQMENDPTLTVAPWDYSYYSNLLKASKYDYNEEEYRPYFELNNVIDGVFGLATKLYGLTFTYNPDIEVYHPEVKAYEVKDKDGSYVGIIYTDFFPRDSKSPGAWMTGFRPQSIDADGTNERPHVSIVMNFTKPTADAPSLLTPYEVETFLHEFGHALHGLLANTKYASMSGTSVYRDFVELPSQFNENYLTEKEFLDGFARHYKTGEAIPQELVDKLVKSSQYGAAYSCVRQLNFGYLDMAWHSITEAVDDPVAFENAAIEQVQIFPAEPGAMISPQFSHIFAGGYAAGYYSYKWAEVLDADAFAHFKENGIFDWATAQSFRKNILEKGGTENPAELYRRFRGHDATIDALLERDGIKKADEQLPAPLPQPRKD